MQLIEQALATLESAGIRTTIATRFSEPAICIETASGVFVTSLLGAQVLEWRPAAGKNVLWLTDETLHTPGNPIRGGIPVCWPWFGAAHPPFDGPAHGFARRRHWQLVKASRNDQQVSLHWQLEIEAGGYLLGADYHVYIGQSLTLQLVTSNLGSESCVVTPAFHPYFAVDELQTSRLQFAKHVQPRDRLTGHMRPATAQLAFNDEELELEWSPWRDIELICGGNSRVKLSSGDATHCVAWNPGPKKAATPSDLAQGAYEEFVCIEPGKLGQGSEEVGAGATSTLSMQLSSG